MPPSLSPDAKLDVLVEAILFLVRHGVASNMADAFIADLHRTFAANDARRAFVDDLVDRLKERDEFVAENDA